MYFLPFHIKVIPYCWTCSIFFLLSKNVTIIIIGLASLNASYIIFLGSISRSSIGSMNMNIFNKANF